MVTFIKVTAAVPRSPWRQYLQDGFHGYRFHGDSDHGTMFTLTVSVVPGDGVHGDGVPVGLTVTSYPDSRRIERIFPRQWSPLHTFMLPTVVALLIGTQAVEA